MDITNGIFQKKFFFVFPEIKKNSKKMFRSRCYDYKCENVKSGYGYVKKEIKNVSHYGNESKWARRLSNEIVLEPERRRDNGAEGREQRKRRMAEWRVLTKGIA